MSEQVKPLWRRRPHEFWMRGSLQYILMRLFRERARQPMTAHQREQGTAEVLSKMGWNLGIQEKPSGCSAIRQAVKRLPRKDKAECDRFLAEKRLGLKPIPS